MEATSALVRQAVAAGAVGEAEAVEMYEAAEAAHMAALEQLAHQHYHLASVYDMAAEDGAEPPGFVSRGTLLSQENEHSRIIGRITYHDDGRLAMYSHTPATFLGYIDGLVWTDLQGHQVKLVERGRYVEGKLVESISDADTFRLALDAFAVAREAGDQARMRILALRIRLARFRICPACGDSFAIREDCTQCAGLGFRTTEEWSR
ncbi:hypothetical protein ACA097_09460 [Pseudomonas sp. QL9]|uniref:hypothetical protein n=1 Tax=Pseudomonas sp. QL9 TaxID=3242725 RepID=UPI00352A00A1